MSPRDPRAGHPGHDPSEPPKRALGVDLPRRPAVPPPPDAVVTSAPMLPPEPRPSVFERARGASWTPTAIAGAIVLVVTALGGQAGVSALLGASKDTQQAILDSEARLTAALERKLEERDKAAQAARDAQSARITAGDERTAYVAGFACALNGGKPHPTFPCDGFPVAVKANKATKTPPWQVTDKPYPAP